MNAVAYDKRTPLHSAVQWNQLKRVEGLLQHGADPKAVDDKGETLLHLTEDPDITALLIEKGADVNVVDKNGRTPLDVAIQQDRTAVADVLKSKGAKTRQELEKK